MIVDAAVHPFMSDAAYRARLDPPWRDTVLPRAFGKMFETSFPEVADREAAADPRRVGEVLASRGVAAAVLTPLTRGLLPNPRYTAAVNHATNTWIQEEWLDLPDSRCTFAASIRLTVMDTYQALREIETWSDDHRFVQVAVPARALTLYGNEQYFPIWEAAAERGLPVYVQDDLATAGEYPNTPVGQSIHFPESDGLRQTFGVVQLASLITNGVFRRLPDLRFIFGDGGIDAARVLLWRIDGDWRNGRAEVPWVEELPSVIAERHARFVTSVHDATADGDVRQPEVLRIARAASMLLYGSHHPYWDEVVPERAASGLDDEGQAAVLAMNALDVIPRLARAVGSPAAA